MERRDAILVNLLIIILRVRSYNTYIVVITTCVFELHNSEVNYALKGSNTSISLQFRTYTV